MSNPRKFKLDMGGMAFSTAVLKEKKPRFDPAWQPGYLEPEFMDLLVDSVEELEPLGGDCRKVLLWHVKTNARKPDVVVKGDEEYLLLKKLV